MLSASLILSLALLAGRMAGLLRELGLASVFGITSDGDLAVLILTLPDLLVNLLISGGISAALVPRFSALQPDQAIALLRRVSIGVLAVFAIGGLVLVTWPRAVFFPIAPGIDPSPVTGGGLIALALALPLTGLAGVVGAYLNAQHRFLVAGCGTLFFNATVLAALALAQHSANPLTLLAIGIACGAAVRLASQLVLLPSRILWLRVPDKLVDLKLVRAFWFATSAAALALLAPIIVRAVASSLGGGAIASFNYAQKLVELPVTILVTSIATVGLSRLSGLHAKGEHTKAAASALHDARYAVLVGLTVMLFGALFADTAVDIVFMRGKLNEVALARIAGLTSIAMLGVPWTALGSIATASLNAAGRVNVVFKATALSLLVLPLLALPGLWLRSEGLLMMAVVTFQLISAVYLAKRAHLPLLGRRGVFGVMLSPHFAAVLALVGLSAVASAAVGHHAPWMRLLVGGSAFVAAMALPLRRFVRFSTEPLELATS
jgi:putative peptidoglycan lipid II flippase